MKRCSNAGGRLPLSLSTLSQTCLRAKQQPVAIQFQAVIQCTDQHFLVQVRHVGTVDLQQVMYEALQIDHLQRKEPRATTQEMDAVRNAQQFCPKVSDLSLRSNGLLGMPWLCRGGGRPAAVGGQSPHKAQAIRHEKKRLVLFQTKMSWCTLLTI